MPLTPIELGVKLGELANKKINDAADKIAEQAFREALVQSVEAVRQAALAAAQAAQNGADTQATAEGMTQIHAMLESTIHWLTGANGGQPGEYSGWQGTTAFSAYNSFAKAVLEAVNTAGGAATAARDKVQAVAYGLTKYVQNEDGLTAYAADKASGDTVGDGPIGLTSEGPCINPSFFWFKAADGNYYPITAGLLSDVLNLLNLYPRG